MTQSLVTEGPSSSKISARSANKWSSNGHGRHIIPALYFVMVPSIGLFTTTIIMLWPSNGKKLAVYFVFAIYSLHVHRILPGSHSSTCLNIRKVSINYVRKIKYQLSALSMYIENDKITDLL